MTTLRNEFKKIVTKYNGTYDDPNVGGQEERFLFFFKTAEDNEAALKEANQLVWSCFCPKGDHPWYGESWMSENPDLGKEQFKDYLYGFHFFFGDNYDYMMPDESSTLEPKSN